MISSEHDRDLAPSRSSSATSTNSDADQERKAKDWLLPVALVVFILFLPLVFHMVLGGAAVGWAVLISYCVLAFGIGLVDARLFRPSWTLPSLAGIAYFLAMNLYFQDGTFLYLPLVVVLVVLGNKLGKKENTQKVKA